MSEAKHTPGPWVWRDDDVSEFSGSYRLGPGVLATELPDGTPWGDDIDRANARLIAAAPDMYEALRSARDIVSANCDGLYEVAVLEEIDSALSKVEGRS